MCHPRCTATVPDGARFMRNVETTELASIDQISDGTLHGRTADAWTRQLTGRPLVDCLDDGCEVFWCPLDVTFYDPGLTQLEAAGR